MYAGNHEFGLAGERVCHAHKYQELYEENNVMWRYSFVDAGEYSSRCKRVADNRLSQYLQGAASKICDDSIHVDIMGGRSCMTCMLLGMSGLSTATKVFHLAEIGMMR